MADSKNTLDLRITPCPCGDRVCKKVYILGLTCDGRWDRADAERVVASLSIHTERKSLLTDCRSALLVAFTYMHNAHAEDCGLVRDTLSRISKE